MNHQNKSDSTEQNQSPVLQAVYQKPPKRTKFRNVPKFSPKKPKISDNSAKTLDEDFTSLQTKPSTAQASHRSTERKVMVHGC